ncbi:MAG: conjugal transfer protein TraR [Chloroflexi bacterium]|nr:conjugal transfer protein TraR [Chloroflexota bacterium]
MINDSTSKEKEELLARRASLLADIEALKETLRGEVDIDVDEGDPDVIEREKSVALLATLEAQLAATEDALNAIEKGTYGICERCGQPISPERLAVKPEATLCVKCQAEVERLQKRGMATPRSRWNVEDYSFG